jgi:putative MATE family efflux protein
VLLAVTAGTTALVSRSWGAGDHAEAERLGRASLWLCLVLALVLLLPPVLAAEQLVSIFRLDAQTLEQAAGFLRVLSWFALPLAVQVSLTAALRAAGDVLTPLLAGALTQLCNVIAVYGLVYGAFGLPELGVMGAGLGTGCAYTAGAAMLAGLWLRGRLVLRPGRERALSLARMRRLLGIGYPAALEQFAWQGGFLGFMWIVSLYGTAPYAAYGIGVNILAFSFLVGFGFSIAASTLVGQHLGAGDPEAATRSGWNAMRLSIGAMLALGAVIVAGARPIAAFLIDDPEVVSLTVVFIYMLGSVQPLMAVEYSLSGALRGAGDTRFPLITVLSGLFGVRLLLAGIFAWLELPVQWVFAALIGDYLVKAAMVTARFRGNRWRNALAAAGPPLPATAPVSESA